MSEVYYEVHITRIVHTSWISNVDSVMFLNRIREMVSFQLGKEIEKDVFRLVASFFYQAIHTRSALVLISFPVVLRCSDLLV